MAEILIVEDETAINELLPEKSGAGRTPVQIGV